MTKKIKIEFEIDVPQNWGSAEYYNPNIAQKIRAFGEVTNCKVEEVE